MIAIHLERGQVAVKNQRPPERESGFAAIRLLYGGICNTDLELQRGYYEFRGIPGHEFVGIVEEADNADWIGKRVVGEINLACNHCDWCRRGLGRHCPQRTVLGILKHPGAFREVLTLPEANLHALPSSIPDTHAVFVEPLAAACEILDQVSIPQGTEVAVLGDGKLGLLISQVLQIHGAKVQQFGRYRSKLQIAEPTGVTGTVIKRRLPRAAFDFVVDATGSAEGVQTAAAMVRPRGTLILKSTVHEPVSVNMAPLIVNEITLIGSRCGRFEPAIKLLQNAPRNRLDVASLISNTVPLREAPAAFALAATKGTLKVLLQN